MKRRRFGLALLAVATPVRARGLPPEIAAELPDARLQGRGLMRFMGLRVYEARLWVAAPALGAAWASVPLALEIEYARRLGGTQIAERTLAEMGRQAEIDAARREQWLANLKSLIPDVAEGDRITGVQRPGESTRLFVNGRLQGELRDPAFTRLFFGIWLSKGSSEPTLRDALLGGAR